MINRREFVQSVVASGAIAIAPRVLAAEPPPETTQLRIAHIRTGLCSAPLYVAEELLRAEGFSALRYVRHETSATVYPALAAGEIDFGANFIAPSIVQADRGGQVVILSGTHPGCIELFGSKRVRTLRDLKGKAVSIPQLGSAAHAFIASMLAHVGLNPRSDVNWLEQRQAEAFNDLAGGNVDALIATPPRSFELRARKIGHVIVNMTTDRPWSQYFCCVLTVNRNFLRKYPVATKRAMRAILKATDLCVSSPEPSARLLTKDAFGFNYEASLQLFREIPYANWRALDVEDAVRFYALRLHEAGMIKSSPQKIIAQATDWRLLNELKQELKA